MSSCKKMAGTAKRCAISHAALISGQRLLARPEAGNVFKTNHVDEIHGQMTDRGVL